MTGLIILGIIILIIVLIALIPVGADVAFENGVLTVSAKVCGVLIQLFPRPPKPPADPNAPPPKPKKPKKERKKPPKDGAKPKKKFKLSFTKEEIFALVKKVMQGLGKFRKMRIDRFKLHFIAGGKDPYDTVMLYGYLNAALSTLAPIGVERFHVDSCDIYTAFDYTLESPKVDCGIALSIRIGQIFAVLNTILFGALGIFIKNRIRLRRQNRLMRVAQAINEAETITDDTENNQTDERNNSNG